MQELVGSENKQEVCYFGEDNSLVGGVGLCMGGVRETAQSPFTVRACWIAKTLFSCLPLRVSI